MTARLRRKQTSCVNPWVEIADVGLLSSAARSALRAALGGDSRAGHPLGGSEVGHGARRCGDGDGDVSLQRAVVGGVVGHAVLPAAPTIRHQARPRVRSARVVVASGAGGGVEVLGPGVPVAGAVRQRAEWVSRRGSRTPRRSQNRT